MVIIGVLGEGIELLIKWTHKRSFRSKFQRCQRRALTILAWHGEPKLLLIDTVSFAVLMSGLSLEFWAGQKALQISHQQNAILTTEASQALKDAGEANERAAKANERAANAELALAKLKYGRSISDAKKREFIFLTEKIAKVPIRIEIIAQGRDTEQFAIELRDMFTMAGFKTNSEAGSYGITREPALYITPSVGETNEVPDVRFLWSFNSHDKIFFPEGSETTNGVTRYSASQTNQEALISALALSLNQIGLSTDTRYIAGLGSPFYIYIPVK